LSLSPSPRAAAALRFILSAVCQVRMITSPTRPMAWLSDEIIEKRADVVQDVLGRDGLLADAAFGEGDVLGDRRARWWQTISMSRCSSSVLTV
jgi:hypothetical protein